MKKIKYVVMLSAAFIFAACGDNASTGSSEGTSADTTHQDEASDAHEHSHEGHSHSTFYTCLDHQDVHEHEAGKCPKCQKDLVAMEEESHEGHEHGSFYTCTDHPDVHEHEAGKCPKCEKQLVEKADEAH
jgi:hypothetical protein